MSSDVGVVVRPIADGDWDAVYRDLQPRSSPKARPTPIQKTLTSEEARSLWVEGPPVETVVALRDDVILGTAHVRSESSRRAVRTSRPPVSWSLERRGIGRGRAMCEYAIAWAREQGYAGMQFNAVVSTNVHAIELYRKLGFVTIGTVPGAFDSATQGRVGLDIMYLEF